MRVDHEKVDHEKKSDRVRVHQSHGGELTMRKSHRVRVHHKQEPWGES